MFEEACKSIKDARKEKGLLIADIAKGLGITKAQVYRKEDGKYSFTLRELLILNIIFGDNTIKDLFNKDRYNGGGEKRKET